MRFMIEKDTICAIATAQGGAIGTIRVSGPSAIEVTDRLYVSPSGRKLAEAPSNSVNFGRILTAEGEVVDEVLVSVFRAPHSYTGENSTEIMCHGSSYILQQVMQLLVQAGCRGALPGEYTQRAFLNGKMDLSQAEAVADLIASSNASTHRLAMSQMRGGFSKELAELRALLLKFTSLIELELDFSEEDVEFANRGELTQLADRIEQFVARLVDSFKVGNAIKNGIPVAIIGETNAGKSTLLNLLVKDERAIVSDIHGTTRDVIEDLVNLRGVTYRFIDTAGIRETTDTIESLGIERTFRKLEQAELVLWMIDATVPCAHYEALAQRIEPLCAGKKMIRLLNKSDQLTPDQRKAWEACLSTTAHLFISAKEQENIASLEQWLVDAAALPQITQNDVVVTNVRHYEALCHTLDAIHRVQEGLSQGISGDFLSQDIREAIFYLSDIVGEVTNDEVLGNIFKNFCIGK
jgi:tRNA modification GTPase